jgi:cell division protein FtsN
LRDPARGSTGAVVPGTGGPFPAVSAFPQASPPPASPSEPKRVRTVTIRNDQGTLPAGGMAAPPARTTARAPAPSPAAPSAPPLAITPGQQPAAPLTMADATPAAPPPRAPSARAEGGYVVQLSAQKSEAEAQASFRAMQAKYAALNGQQPLIRRKDQGDRGVFYAAQVGPFGSKDEAAQFCEGLKSAGGSCFVLRN